MRKRISRRTLLKGVGTAIALPTLEAMQVGPSRASTDANGNGPVRLLWFHTESGMWMPSYKPSTLGAQFELSPTLAPLAPFRDQLSVLTGLYHENAFRRNPQTGRHAQDAMCHLTGSDLGGTPGVAVRNGVSIDQLAAMQIGEQTRLPSLQLSPARSGYLSFTPSGTGVPNRWNPQEVFSVLFEDGSPEAKQQAQKRFLQKESILDSVIESTQNLNATLGHLDRHTLDAYLTNVREVERRVQVAKRWSAQPAKPIPPGVQNPPPAPESNRRDHIRLLLDMLVLALQTDQTRLATFQIGFMGCSYPGDGLPDSYHGYTHHDNQPEKQAAMANIDRIRIEHLAYFLEKLRSTREGSSTLLAQCVVHYGSGMGSWHESTDIANLIVGGAGGKLTSVGHVDYGGAPLSNLYVRMLELAGVSIKSFADSTGPLKLG